jgi:hypothetical protein
LSRFTSTKVINTRWRNNDFVGAAGSTHTFPDAFHEEFLVDWALQISDGSVVITETPTTGVIQMSSLTVGDITLTGTATGFPGAPTIIGTSPISVATAAGTSTISLNANYQTVGTYVTSVTGTAPITASGTTAITVGIDQSAITGATAATNAQVVRFFVKNTTGTTIPKGSAVYVSGATGDNALISLASATSEASSSKTLGITAEAIATDAFGYVIEAGYLTDIDTSATTAGAAVWLGNTPGSLVFVTPPAEPSHAVYLGVVVRVQSMNGSILVKVQNGYELDELHDVSAASPSDGDIIQYKTSSSLWTKSAPVDSITSTSTTSVPTANAVRIANNAATAAQSTADGKLSASGDTLTGTMNVTGVGAIRIFTDAATSPAPFTTTVSGDAVNRFAVTANARIEFGSGTATRDTNLYRSGANALKTDDALDVVGALTNNGTAVSISGHTHSTSSITSGNFVATLAAGTGVTVTGADANAAAKTVSIGQAVATSSSPVFAALTVNGDITATSMPIRMASGTYSMSASAAATGNTTVTFPSGRFSVAPNVTITVASGPGGTAKVVPRHIGVSTSSFTGYWYTGDATNTTFTSCAFQYIAIQMTSASASG